MCPGYLLQTRVAVKHTITILQRIETITCSQVNNMWYKPTKTCHVDK